MNVIRHSGACPGPTPPRPRGRYPAMVMCCLVMGFTTSVAGADHVRWRSDYAKALKEATDRGVPLMLNIGSENCFWCKQLDARTFVDEEIIRMLNERCVPLKIDGNKVPSLTQALKVQSYPTLIFASHDGNILAFKEGFIEAPVLKDQLTKVLASVGTPDWMQRDYDAALKAISSSDTAKAITMLRSVVEDGKARPIQTKARTLLADLEKQASEHAAKARNLAEKGKTTEAIAALDKIGRSFPGTLAARRSKQLVVELANRTKEGEDDRKRQAAEMLRLAKEDFKGKHYLCCLDRCEILTTRYRDLPEASEAGKLASEIKDNPEWTREATDQLGDRLCLLYLAMADTLLKKGQPQQAVYYLERVVKLFPSSKYAETAQTKLARVRGTPTGNR